MAIIKMAVIFRVLIIEISIVVANHDNLIMKQKAGLPLGNPA